LITPSPSHQDPGPGVEIEKVRTINAMDIASSDALKDELLKKDPTFRDLVHQHQNYEQRLRELSGLTYPSDDEQIEESTLKKKKLMVKDEIYAMMHNYEVSH
jgi:uncharacterized protein YdcH (DUF465 family)